MGPAATVQEGRSKEEVERPASVTCPGEWPALHTVCPGAMVEGAGITGARNLGSPTSEMGLRQHPHLLPCLILWGPELRAAAPAQAPGQVSPLPGSQSPRTAIRPSGLSLAVGCKDAEAAVTWLGGGGGAPPIRLRGFQTLLLSLPWCRNRAPGLGMWLPGSDFSSCF